MFLETVLLLGVKIPVPTMNNILSTKTSDIVSIPGPSNIYKNVTTAGAAKDHPLLPVPQRIPTLQLTPFPLTKLPQNIDYRLPFASTPSTSSGCYSKQISISTAGTSNERETNMNEEMFHSVLEDSCDSEGQPSVVLCDTSESGIRDSFQPIGVVGEQIISLKHQSSSSGSSKTAVAAVDDVILPPVILNTQPIAVKAHHKLTVQEVFDQQLSLLVSHEYI